MWSAEPAHGRRRTSPWKLADLSTYVWVDDEHGLTALCDRLSSQDRVAIDTEFHRERTYFPELALVQIGLGRETFLVDPLACDVAQLGTVLNSDVVWLAHAAQQDIEVLQLATGKIGRAHV